MAHASYRHLAQVYDRLMQDVPYNAWLTWAEKMWGQTETRPATVVDLACGTGMLTWRLAQTGRTVIGVDRSSDMLAVAAGKEAQYDEACDVRWLEQDMRELQVPHQVDTVVCFCDSLNYLLTEEDWKKTFRAVFQALLPGGLFLFDVHSVRKVRDVLGNHLFAWEEADVYCVWHNRLDDTNCLVEEHLTLFVEQGDGRYERFDELHQQRAFPAELIRQWLEEAGFTVSSTVEEHEGERLFFCAQKRK